MASRHCNLLIPEQYKFKNTKVKVFKPQVILLDFHGTISERKWEDKVIYPYVKKSVCQFIKDNWTDDAVQRCIPSLRNESFEQRFRHKYEDAPVIDETTGVSEDDNEQEMMNQVGEFLLWQMTTRRETKETQQLERLVWLDGFRKGRILLPLYDDVMPNVKRWTEQFGCKIYLISSVDSVTLKLLLENTDKGNLSKYITDNITSHKPGQKLISEIYKQFSDKLLLTPPISPIVSQTSTTSPNKTGGKVGDVELTCTKTIIGSNPRSPQTQVINSRPVLFITDSGQEAKAAAQVADGDTYECILISRPGNKKLRTYYLTRFAYVEKFDDIEFV